MHVKLGDCLVQFSDDFQRREVFDWKKGDILTTRLNSAYNYMFHSVRKS